MTSSSEEHAEGQEGTLRGDIPRSEPVAAPPAEDAVHVLEQALAQVESILGRLEERGEQAAPSEKEQKMSSHELTELRRALREVVQRLEDALDHLGIEAQRLTDETSRLSLVADRLEARLDRLTQAPGESRPPESPPAPKPEPLVAQEPQFQPDGAMGIVIAAVPGFQGLMDMQRGLSSLPSVAGASVVAYRNGEASLEVALRAPVSARQIVERLRESTNHELLIEEARTGELRLRLRFVDREGQGFGPNSGPNG